MSALRTKPPRSNVPGPTPSQEDGGLLGRWPFRRKLNVLTFVPVLALAGLLGVIAWHQVDQAREAATTARCVRNSEELAELVDGLQSEHRQALLVSLRYEAAGATTTGSAPKGSAPDTTAYRHTQAQVDRMVTDVRKAFGSELPAAEAEALKETQGLGVLRSTIEQGPFPANNIDTTYNDTVDDIISGLGLNAPGATGPGSKAPSTLLGSPGSLLEALLSADTAHAAFETSVFASRTGDASALVEFTSAVSSYGQYGYQSDRFARYASQAQGRQLVEGMDRSSYEGTISDHYTALSSDPSNLVADGNEVHGALELALKDEPVYAHQAQKRLDTTRSLIRQIAAGTEQSSHEAFLHAAELLAGALLGLALWVGFSVLARRSVLGTVLALTRAARRVADAAGQELARVADDDAADASPPRLPAVPVPVHDEIGELAEAFNRVQVTATALLERQVLSRRNIAEMFGNVGRRVSNLTARQLALIDAVERGETDPETLERLYRIDHISVRLQRNADSLMLLAGIREPGLDKGPVRLSNVVRAALGQIEAFQRVVPRAEGDVTISPDVVGDLTLMLAELLENAVTFSPASTRVEVMLRPGAVPRMGSGPRGEGAVVEITDHGLGMSPERLDEENARLVRRERLDLVPTKVLGLFVVGVLSRRWGIRVTLARTPGGGVTARVVVPSVHLLPMDPPDGTAEPADPQHDRHTSPGASRTPSAPESARPVRSSTPGGLPRRVPNRAPVQSGHRPDAAPPAPAGIPPLPGVGRTGGAAAPGGMDPTANGTDGTGPQHAPVRPRDDWGDPEDRDRGHGHGGRDRQDPSHPALPRRTGPAWARPGPMNSSLGPDTAPPAAEAAGAPGARHANPYAPGTQEHSRAPEPARPDAGPAQGAVQGVPGSRAQVPGASSPRPLRRRVRGATLSATTASDVFATQRAASARSLLDPMGWRQQDAEAARSELDEFEAAVAQAERDAAHFRGAPRESGPHRTRPGGHGPDEPAPLPPPSAAPHTSAAPPDGRAPTYQPPTAPAAQQTPPPTSSEGAGK